MNAVALSLLDFLYPRIPLGDWADSFITWFGNVFGWLLDAFTWLMQSTYQLLFQILAFPKILVDNGAIADSSVLRALIIFAMILVFAGIAWIASNWKVALFTVLGFYAIWALAQWENAMSTLALVLVAVIVALILALPLGVLAAKSQIVSTIVKPILDFMQAMPALAYLVPAIVMFSVGVVPGAFATIIFAMPPGVRLTELAIRQVAEDKVEAAQAFGATPSHILFKVQLPLAMATIMAGINQVIMLAASRPAWPSSSWPCTWTASPRAWAARPRSSAPSAHPDRPIQRHTERESRHEEVHTHAAHRCSRRRPAHPHRVRCHGRRHSGGGGLGGRRRRRVVGVHPRRRVR
jgi:glycine betaine/proline transport system permease protein